MIVLRQLTKQYGRTTAVADLSLDIQPGVVTGFLGPNGAGKSTTMRIIVGVDHPSAGKVHIDDTPYREIRRPLRGVGALLDARAAHPGRSGRNHLLAMARSNGIAGRRVGSYSLGMAQRLGIAGALLGDPPVLIFDEPVNGLDPDGVRWFRGLARRLAGEGRTVLVPSHLMSELQLTADHIVILGRGRLLADAPIDELTTVAVTRVRAAQTAGVELLARRLTEAGHRAEPLGPLQLRVAGADPAQVGELAHQAGVPLHELVGEAASLEEAYLRLTDGSVEYPAGRAA